HDATLQEVAGKLSCRPFSFPGTWRRATWRRSLSPVIERLGRRTVDAIKAVGGFGHFVGDLARAVPDVAVWGRLTLVQMRRVGVDSLPDALFITAFTGVVLALQASYTFTGTDPLYFVVTLVGQTMMRAF